MKIVILVSYTFPFVGSGLGQVAQIQAEKLAKKGHRVVLVSSNVPQYKKKFNKNGVLHIKQKSINILDKIGVPVPLFFLSKEVLNLIKNTDIVHSHDMLYPHSLFAAIAAKIYGKPFILTQHAGFIVYKSRIINLIQLLANKTLGQLVLRLSDKIILINEEVKSWMGVSDKRVATLLNGVDTKLFKAVSAKKKKELRKKYKLPLDKKIVLYVGRLVEKKGYHRAYEAGSKDYLVLIAGGGDKPKYMDNDKDKVRFLGNLKQKDLSEIYQLSDVFILPSDCGGFPLSIQEAMASGLPIITSKHPGFEKYLDRRYVVFIKPETTDLKKAIRKVLADTRLRSNMVNYSLSQAKNYSWEKNIGKLVSIYKELS